MSLYFQVGLQTHGSAWVRDNANPRLAPEPPEGLGAVTGSEHKPSALFYNSIVLEPPLSVDTWHMG